MEEVDSAEGRGVMAQPPDSELMSHTGPLDMRGSARSVCLLSGLHVDLGMKSVGGYEWN